MLDTLRKNKLDIIKRYEAGESTVILGKVYNCDSSLIWRVLDENNANIRTRSKNYNNMNQYKKQICSLFENDYSCYKIGKLLGLCDSTIVKSLRRWGYDTSKKKTRKDNDLVSNYKKEVIKLYMQGSSYSQIGKKLGFSRRNICVNLVKWGYVVPGKTYKYSVKEDFFKEGINTSEQAYLLGLLYADGSVNSGGTMKISLQDRDEHILQEIKTLLGYTGPLYTVKKQGNRYQQKCLCISRKTLVDDIIRLGCIPNKTFKLVFPTNDIVPNNLIWHFIRGVFDGDGSVTKYSFSITGCYDFVLGISNFLNNINMEHKIYQRYPDRDAKKSCHSLFIYKKQHRLKFFNLLYENSTIYLDRKYNKALNLLSI